MIIDACLQPGFVMEIRIALTAKTNLILANLRIGHVLEIYSLVTTATAFLEHTFVTETMIVWMDRMSQKSNNVIHGHVIPNLNLNVQLIRHMDVQCVFLGNGCVMEIRTAWMEPMKTLKMYQTVP